MKKFKVTGIYYTYIYITLLLFYIQLFTTLSADINIFWEAGTVIETDFTRMSVWDKIFNFTGKWIRGSRWRVTNTHYYEIWNLCQAHIGISEDQNTRWDLPGELVSEGRSVEITLKRTHERREKTSLVTLYDEQRELHELLMNQIIWCTLGTYGS